MKRWSASLLLLASPATAQTTDAFAGVPGVTFRPYAVTGSDAAALRRSMDAARPVDPHGDERVDALTHWTMAWQWPGRRHGGCTLSRATLSFSATVILPRLADPAALPPVVLEEWARYIAALERHEANHVRHAFQQRSTVLAAIRGATCATADRAGRKALAAIVAHDLAYDRDTHHGASEGASFPLWCNSTAIGSRQSSCTTAPDPTLDPTNQPG